MSTRLPGVLRARFGSALCAASALALATPATALADFPGSLDPTFSDDGILTASLAPGDGIDSIAAVAVQPDGKVVAVGEADTDSTSGVDRDFAVARFTSAGTLDTTFGGGDGVVITPIEPSAGSNSALVNESATSVAVQTDGKIVVGGSTDHVGGAIIQQRFVVARYTAAGSLDSGFDGDGIAFTGSVGSSETLADLAIQSDGKIVVAGTSSGQFSVARLTSSGALDETFDGNIGTGNGKFNTDMDGSSPNPSGANAVAIQPDGEIVVGGLSVDSSARQDFALARYSGTDGVLDTSFDADGRVITNLSAATSGHDSVRDVAIDASGRIVAAGVAAGSSSGDDFALARYSGANGALDSGFSTDGKLTIAVSAGSLADAANSVAVDQDGKIVAGGTANAGAGRHIDFAVIRVEAGGALDAAFDGDGGSGDGKVLVPIGPGAVTDTLSALALQPSDGRIVGAGSAETGTSSGTDAALVRLVRVKTPPDTVITGGPSGPTNDSTPTFTFASVPSSGFTFECRFAPVGLFGACSGANSETPDTPLPDGSYTFEVQARDVDTIDPTPATRSFTVDTVAPPAPSLSGPGGKINDPTPTFSFSSAGAASFDCRVLPGGSFQGCSSPRTLSGLADGSHSFSVRATDAAGNLGPASSSDFALDTVAPQTTITSGPRKRTDRRKAKLRFEADEPGATFECKLDGRDFRPCSSPAVFKHLKPRKHAALIRATDGAGNVEPTPAKRTWKVRR